MAVWPLHRFHAQFFLVPGTPVISFRASAAGLACQGHDLEHRWCRTIERWGSLPIAGWASQSFGHSLGIGMLSGRSTPAKRRKSGGRCIGKGFGRSRGRSTLARCRKSEVRLLVVSCLQSHESSAEFQTDSRTRCAVAISETSRMNLSQRDDQLGRALAFCACVGIVLVRVCHAPQSAGDEAQEPKIATSRVRSSRDVAANCNNR
jgi:hypothetical protein